MLMQSRVVDVAVAVMGRIEVFHTCHIDAFFVSSGLEREAQIFRMEDEFHFKKN